MADNVQLNPGAGGSVIAADDIGGVAFQRVKVVHGADGTNDGDVSRVNPLPVLTMDHDRTVLAFWAVAAAAGTTGTETAITLSRSNAPGATVTTGTSFVVTSGKRFRLTSMTVATRGNATATVQTTTFALRVNTGGAVTTSSAVMLSARSATPATASAWDRVTLTWSGDGPEITGDGTLQFGMTAAATYTTNAPTWDVTITGYEY
jgi:hypothetical protein